MNCGVGEDDPSYIKAYGIFESDIIIDVLSPHLKHFTSTPMIKLTRPVGLLALVVAALERAFDAYGETGSKPTEYDDFTKDYASTAVEQYGRMIASLRDSHWASIYAACGVKQEQKKPVTMGHKTPLASRRDRLRIPSSP
ncbi:uncharacterized protein SCHCODRAFT_02519424 [Schizophyllum commune H4-8]|uniref:Expressed protein n=1 Tax=Schizophyllum commune (strain H4-8 / FGSC 9210) TaxID=578458 RepID=D8QIR3_SCHCM|nr:uncharacterized protein SCHCODRAFT_02519424 [Schizophyllum commune H4-8]KAI5886110.1 hypothetical protein SCHCODRAFT_02519424 [Schizophyllum commune H4-8]